MNWNKTAISKHSPMRKKLHYFIFSAFFSLAFLLGLHIHVEDAYAGSIQQNYITPYGWKDFIVYFSVWLLSFLLCIFFSFLFQEQKTESFIFKQSDALPGYYYWILFFVLSIARFLYLLLYSPGFILGDSIGSLSEALRITKLSTRNPVLYTLFIRLCLFLGNAFSSKNITAGCAIYSIVQLLSVCGVLSYFVYWLSSRFDLSRFLIVIISLGFLISTYLAQNSIAMWKDPVFAASIVLLSLSLADYALNPTVASSRKWRIKLAISLLLTLFWRNNGFSAVLPVFLFFLISCFRQKKKGNDEWELQRVLLLILVILLVWLIITGPLFQFFEIGQIPREESVGMMLNQMARVAAYNGNMSQADTAYMNSILPIELYRSSYRPCCVDLLKWDENLNTIPLYNPRFFITWLSLFIKNPRLYFEAWELNSYGFWTVNLPEINLQTANISFGAPLNFSAEGFSVVGSFRLDFSSHLQGQFWEKLLPLDSWSVPLGILNWIIAFIILTLAANYSPRYLLPFFPSVGIIVALLIGTPIWYLPRYELPVQILLPMFLAFPFVAKKQNPYKR